MPRSIPSASRWENIRFLVGQFLPYYLQGIFLRRRFAVRLFTRLGIHPFNPDFFQGLRARHGAEQIYIKLLGRRVLLLFDPRDVRQVLERSPRVYGSPGSKKRGMGHFQPDALTISDGRTWEKRREFNEEVLETSSPLHGQAGAMFERVQCLIPASAPVCWDDFASLFRDLAQTVVFGRCDPDSGKTIDDLLSLMATANRLFWLRPSPLQAEMEGLIRSRSLSPEPGSLLAMFPAQPHDPALGASRQVPHWLFAIADTLPMNLIRALLLISCFPDLRRQVLREIDSADMSNAEGVAKLTLVSGCLQEAMRLWPTTPVIARTMLARDRIDGVEVPPATDVMILNNVLHRDERRVPDANRFHPARWQKEVPPFLFNHMSDGTQGCAGRHLALFLGTAVLASLLRRWDFSALTPVFDPDAPIPLINNHFEICFSATVRGA